MIRVVQRMARRSGERVETDVPGIVFLEIDGIAKPRAPADDTRTGTRRRWRAGLRKGPHRFLEWETDLSSPTGAGQTGTLMGSNDDIPAFHSVEKERGIVIACSAPADCAEIEHRLAGDGLLRNSGAEARGNLPSGEAERLILTVSGMEAGRGRTRATARLRERAQRHPSARPVLLGSHPGVGSRRCARSAATYSRAVTGADLPVDPSHDVRDRPGPHRVRRPRGPDEGAAAVYATSGAMTRSRTAGVRAYRTRSKRCGSSSQQFARMDRARRCAPGRTTSSFFPITVRHKAQPSNSETATASTTSSRGRCKEETLPSSPAATSRMRWSDTR